MRYPLVDFKHLTLMTQTGHYSHFAAHLASETNDQMPFDCERHYWYHSLHMYMCLYKLPKHTITAGWRYRSNLATRPGARGVALYK